MDKFKEGLIILLAIILAGWISTMMFYSIRDLGTESNIEIEIEDSSQTVTTVYPE